MKGAFRIRQILTNLLTNSIKFTSEGSVTLSVVAKREDEESIQVLFTIEDTGIGIEEEVRKRLFKPFSQADSSTARRFGGTGLGLTICKNVRNSFLGFVLNARRVPDQPISAIRSRCGHTIFYASNQRFYTFLLPCSFSFLRPFIKSA